ncbi:MAG: acyl-CoA dehydrogenase [Alphaproteobacteria bacterium]|nr:acyl-CoA dehydrogenase [Alphaproteobacteria bacterium]
MASYKAPVRDMRFILYDLLGADKRLCTLPGWGEFTADLIDPVLEEAGKICEEVLQPLNRSGDEEGCYIENGVVRTPKGFKEAYDAFTQGGWAALTCAPEDGGQGLPRTLGQMVQEMACSANMSLAIYAGLTQGAYAALRVHGSEELKRRYLPKLATGEWSGTMCLTEPHCGTDLGQIRTRAVPQPDGSYKITGTKIFISAGEHDLSRNIIHLVLARLPDAPKGIKGISLFLVPKLVPGADGNPGPRNSVTCASIEHKMGIKGSATCVMNFDEATGWLVGDVNKGMRAMFRMMNEARLAVGVQGMALGEAAYQGAVSYARDRLQGRALDKPRYPDKPADPILVHPDVRRMLLTARAYVEGARALAATISLKMDEASRSEDEEFKQEAEDLAAVMTPIIKALFTDIGFDVANIGVQVFGGHGYIREHGMEQYVRDARITQLYEGTNGVQALDLIGRKMSANGGRVLRRFFHPVEAFLKDHESDGDMADFVQPLAKAFGRLQQASVAIAFQGLKNPMDAAAGATEYLRLFGLVALGHQWALMAKTAQAKLAAGADGDEGFYKAKLATARFYMQRILPQTGALLSVVGAGGKAAAEFDDAQF